MLKLRSAQILLVAALVNGLTACGGSSGDERPAGADPSTVASNAEERLVGRFIDAPVEGLSYFTGTTSSVTDADGVFRYSPGEMVRFSFGDLYLGEALGQSILTPLDLHPNAPAHQVALMSFLQSLDEDSDMSNGIRLNRFTQDQLTGFLNERPGTTTFLDLITHPDYPLLAGRISSRSEWLSESDALANFELEIEPLFAAGEYQRPTTGTSRACPAQPVLELVSLEGGPFIDCGYPASTRIPSPTEVRHGFGGLYPDDPGGMNNQTVCIVPGWDDGIEWSLPNLPDIPIHASDQIYYNSSDSVGVITFTGQRVVWNDTNGGRSLGFLCEDGAANIEYNGACVCN